MSNLLRIRKAFVLVGDRRLFTWRRHVCNIIEASLADVSTHGVVCYNVTWHLLWRHVIGFQSHFFTGYIRFSVALYTTILKRGLELGLMLKKLILLFRMHATYQSKLTVKYIYITKDLFVHQICILEWFLKDRVTLKQYWHHRNKYISVFLRNILLSLSVFAIMLRSACQMAVKWRDGYRGDLSLWWF